MDKLPIKVVFQPPCVGARDFTEHEKGIIEKTAERWEDKFTGGIPDAYPLEEQAGRAVPYYSDFPSVVLPEVIEGIIVYVSSTTRDWGESYNIGNYLPKDDVINAAPAGIIGINAESIAKYYDDPYWRLVRQRQTDILLEDTVAHEIGHILQGHEWYDFVQGWDEEFQYFGGPHATEQFELCLQEAGIEYAGVKVPVISAEPNTQCRHWYDKHMDGGQDDEGKYLSFTFDSSGDETGAEIMSQFPGTVGVHNAISRITLGALKDLGYPVDMNKAEWWRFCQYANPTSPFDE